MINFSRSGGESAQPRLVHVAVHDKSTERVRSELAVPVGVHRVHEGPDRLDGALATDGYRVLDLHERGRSRSPNLLRRLPSGLRDHGPTRRVDGRRRPSRKHLSDESSSPQQRYDTFTFLSSTRNSSTLSLSLFFQAAFDWRATTRLPSQ